MAAYTKDVKQNTFFASGKWNIITTNADSIFYLSLKARELIVSLKILKCVFIWLTYYCKSN